MSPPGEGIVGAAVGGVPGKLRAQPASGDVPGRAGARPQESSPEPALNKVGDQNGTPVCQSRLTAPVRRHSVPSPSGQPKAMVDALLRVLDKAGVAVAPKLVAKRSGRQEACGLGFSFKFGWVLFVLWLGWVSLYQTNWVAMLFISKVRDTTHKLLFFFYRAAPSEAVSLNVDNFRMELSLLARSFQNRIECFSGRCVLRCHDALPHTALEDPRADCQLPTQTGGWIGLVVRGGFQFSLYKNQPGGLHDTGAAYPCICLTQWIPSLWFCPVSRPRLYGEKV